MSKIIIELIYNYKGMNDNDYDINKNEIDKMEYNNIKIIEDNIKYINNELDLNRNKIYIIKQKIDVLYKDIIKKIILKNKLEDYDYTYNIINQLDIESINITNIIFDEINILLKSNENYINRYSISKEKDLFNIDCGIISGFTG